MTVKSYIFCFFVRNLDFETLKVAECGICILASPFYGASFSSTNQQDLNLCNFYMADNMNSPGKLGEIQ